MNKLLLLILLLIQSMAYASDSHQTTQGHEVAYVIQDNSGNPVTGQTVRLQVIRGTDRKILDFNDNTFKSSGWTTRYGTMSYTTDGEYYFRVVTIDNATALVSSDYIFVVSNDDATYGDQQAEVIGFDNLNKLIRMNR